MQSLNARAANKILADHQSAARRTNQAWAKADLGGAIRRSVGGGLNGLKSDLAGLSGMLAGALSVGAAINLADTFTRFQNALKVAGLEGQALAKVQDHLFAAANRNGVAVEGLGQLYGRVAQSASALGASQSQLLTMSDAVTAAIRVNGGTMESASGAMLQLSQALGSPIVRAEEFNSMMEGMRPLLQSAAEASTKYAGSVSAMRNDVLAGKLTSQEFFSLILAGSASLEAKAARAPLTVGQSFETLKNKLIEAIGATNATWGITARLTEALTWLSNNLDTVAVALAGVAAVIATVLAPAIGKATISLVTMTAAGVANGVRMAAQIPAMLAFSASLQGISVGAAAARTGLAMLMSATGVGLAVVALTAAIGFFAAKSYAAAEATRQLRARLAEKTKGLQEARAAADQARQQTGNLTDAELKAATAAASLTGEQDKLKDAYYRVAAAAKAAELAQLRANLAQSETDLRDAGRDYRREYNGRVRTEFSGGGSPFSPNGSATAIANAGDTTRRAREATDRSEAGTALTNAVGGVQADRRALREAEARKLDDYGVRPVAGAGTGGGGRGSRGSSGPSAEDRARNAADMVAAAERELADATRALATTVEERHAAAVAALADDRAQAGREIARRLADKEIDAATAERLNGIEDQVTTAKQAAETARYNEELQTRQRYLTGLENDAAQERLNIEADAAEYLARTATTLDEKHRYERAALEARQRLDDASFAASQETLRLELVKQNATQAEIDAILARNQANRDAAKSQQSGQLANDQRAERGPANLGEWVSGFGRATAAGETFNQKLMGIAEGGINDLTDGITDAIMGAKSFGEAISDMAKSVIASLIRMGVQFLIFETLGRAFGVPGLGRAAIGLSPAKNAAGTNSFEGGLTWVGEKGPELIAAPPGARIMSNLASKRAVMAGNIQRQSSAPIVINTTVQANDAVLTGTVKQWITQANIDALTAAAKIQEKQQQRASRQRF